MLRNIPSCRSVNTRNVADKQLLGYLGGISDKNISMETDGSWQGEDTFTDYLKQVELSARSGVTVIQTVNWELEDIEKYGATYLSKFKALYTNAEPRRDYDETDVILVNTLDFLLKNPPQDLHDLYYYAYKNMTARPEEKSALLPTHSL